MIQEPPQELKSEFFYIDGMTCSACSSSIESALKRKKGIKSIQVDLLNGSAKMLYDPQSISLQEIFAFLKKLGYSPQKQGLIEKIDSKLLTPRKRIALASLFTLLTLCLSMLPMLSPKLTQALIPLPPLGNALAQMLFSLIVMHLARQFYLRGLKALFALHPTMDTLVALGSGAAFLYSLYALSTGALEELYFEGVCVILLFILIGKSIEEEAKSNTQNSLKTLVSLKNAYATKLFEGREQSVPIEQIQIGDILKITPQEMIPVDGILLQGSANLDLSSLNGESLPVSKKEGETIHSGSLNLNTSFLMQVSKNAHDSIYWQILDLVQNTLISKPPIAKLADKLSLYFTPFVLFLACSIGLFWWLHSGDFSLTLRNFCNVLLISCPCALGLATPLALNVATKLASERGVFFKDASILECIGKTQTVFFDKTGTLTQKQLRIKEIISFCELESQDLLQICVSLESQSQHIIAQSLLAQAQDLPLFQVKNIHIQEGLGIRGEIDGIHYKIGSAKNFSPHPAHHQKGIVVFIGREKKNGDEILGYIVLEEKLKEEAEKSIGQLKKLGISCKILSGDHSQNVAKVAQELNIAFNADALPQDKLEVIRDCKGTMMMVGDGVNDSLALCNADISVSMGEGSKVAMASSNCIIFNNNLTNIPYAIKLSQATLRNIKQNLCWAFGYNAVMIPIACGALSTIGILLSPAFASLAMTLSSLSVVLNAQRLKQFKG